MKKKIETDGNKIEGEGGKGRLTKKKMGWKEEIFERNAWHSEKRLPLATSRSVHFNKKEPTKRNS